VVNPLTYKTMTPKLNGRPAGVTANPTRDSGAWAPKGETSIQAEAFAEVDSPYFCVGA
jgi:hypothetical protein